MKYEVEGCVDIQDPEAKCEDEVQKTKRESKR